MFKENRLVRFTDHVVTGNGNNDEEQTNSVRSTDANNPPQDIDSMKAAIRDLDLSSSLAALALNSLDSGDEDEIELVRKLLAKKVKKKNFENRLADIQDATRGIDVDNLSDISSTITNRSHQVSEIQNSVPEDAHLKSTFVGLNNSMNEIIGRETVILGSINTILSPYIQSGKITRIYAKRIANFDPSAPGFKEFLELHLGPEIAADKKLVEKIIKLKEDHKAVLKDYDNLMDRFEVAVNEVNARFSNVTEQYYTVERLSKMCGVTIKSGTKLEYKPEGQQDFTFAEITKIEFTDISSESAITEDNNEKIQKIIITVKDDLNGRPVTRELAQRDFVMWINRNQVSESIKDIDALEQKLNYKGYGQKLAEGDQIEFVTKRESTTGNPVYDSVKIKKIDTNNKTIELDKSVIVSDLELMDEEVYTPDAQTVLTYGEFFNWFKKRSATPSLDLDKAREVIKNAPAVYAQKYQSTSDAFPPINENPIKIQPGEKLTWGDNKGATITAVEPNKITLNNGSVYTPSQFVAFVKDNEVEQSPDQPANTTNSANSTPESNGTESTHVPETQANSGNTPALETESSTDEEDEEDKKEKEEIAKKDQPTPYEKKGELAKMWDDTYVLSWSDIKKFFTTIIDFHKGRQEGISTRRAALIGKTMPGPLGVTFKNQFQARENDSVSGIQGGLENQGVDDWLNELLDAGANTDLIKATTNLLCKSGNFDFEDKRIWKVFNVALKANVSESDYLANRVNENGGKNASGKPPVKALMVVMDMLYGKPSGFNWFNENKSAYTNQMNQLSEEAKEKGAEIQGVETELNTMLKDHKEGKFVSSSRYEAYIRFMIQFGLCDVNDKIFYILAGLTMKGPNDTYLLSRARVGSLDASLMSNLPILNFFSDFKPYKHIEGHPERNEVLPRSYFRKVVKNFNFTGDMSQGKPYDEKVVNKFINEDMMQNKRVRERASLASRGADQSTDHDDTPYNVPMLNTSGILQVLGYTRGDIPMLTEKGHANGLAAFNDHIRFVAATSALSEDELKARAGINFEDPKLIMQAMFKSFLLYEANLAGRVQMGKYMKLDNARFRSPAALAGGGMPLSQSAMEMKNVLAKILYQYSDLNGGDPSKEDIYFMLYQKAGESRPEDNEKMKKLINTFSDTFDRLIDTHKPDLLVKIVQEAVANNELTGFAGKPRNIQPIVPNGFNPTPITAPKSPATSTLSGQQTPASNQNQDSQDDEDEAA